MIVAMRLYRSGSTGEAVRDIQDRLAALGFETADDVRGEFAEATTAATRSFQRSRGLPSDGIIGPDTWRSLYEAGYRLGDRLLYLRRPMLRGEDVAELQSRFNGLGFDAGKVDAIFGPDAQRATYEFQANRNLTEDGVAGPEVITELKLVTRGPIRTGREAIREREWLRSERTIVGAANIGGSQTGVGCRQRRGARVPRTGWASLGLPWCGRTTPRAGSGGPCQPRSGRPDCVVPTV